MTKHELMENYTIEQLADMVIEKEKQLDQVRVFGIFEKIKESGLFENPIKTFYEADLDIKQEIIDRLKKRLSRKEAAINQIDSIICELFGISHNGDEYTEDFKELLMEKSKCNNDEIEDNKTISDFLPTEPIKAADMLINVHKRDLYKDSAYYSKIYDISELRQIAEHLLVYCNANMEGEA